MKKLILFLTSALIMCGALTACSNKDGSAQSSEPQDMEQTARGHIENMVKGEYDKVNEDMAAATKLQVSAKVLEQAFVQTTAESGEYLNNYTLEVQQKDGQSSYVALLDYQNNYIKLTLSYDEKGKINGIWLKPQAKEIELADNEKFAEAKIQVGEYQLDGILTTPKGIENPPVVVMVQGSGSSDYNETISANHPFLDIAHSLAQQGIATVRFNKRYYQKPELAGDGTGITIYDEYMDDVYAAIKIAQQTSDRVYVLGHSLGGMSVPKIAKDNPQVKGIIALAGTPRGLEDAIYDQNVMSINAMDTTNAQKELLLQSTKKYYNQVKALTEDDGSAPFGISAKYWLSLKELNTLEISKNLTIPMLIMQGEQDFQVYADKDFEYWKKELTANGNTNATFKLYPKLSHLFIEGGSKDILDTSIYNTAGTVDEQVTKDIAEWIIKQEK